MDYLAEKLQNGTENFRLSWVNNPAQLLEGDNE